MQHHCEACQPLVLQEEPARKSRTVLNVIVSGDVEPAPGMILVRAPGWRTARPLDSTGEGEACGVLLPRLPPHAVYREDLDPVTGEGPFEAVVFEATVDGSRVVWPAGLSPDHKAQVLGVLHANGIRLAE